jgi:Domain of unknown function (4846)
MHPAMRRRYSFLLSMTSLTIFMSCALSTGDRPAGYGINPYPVVGSIPAPAGYRRTQAGPDDFATWLRKIPLKKDRTVYLYDGSPKRNQDAQFAVLDVSVGHKDLQQCADAVMRLRSEFLYSRKDCLNIDFYTEQGVRLNFREWENGRRVRLKGDQLIRYTLPRAGHFCDSRACFDDYLETVFSYCGTRSLAKQLIAAPSFNAIRSGDVLIRGGSPGHAMLVMDVAEDVHGRRIYMLAQSYMPAQDIHIVNNPSDTDISPWFRADSAAGIIETPEYTFKTNELRTWPQRIGQ